MTPYILSAAAAIVTGILVYIATRKRDSTDDRSKLIADALTLGEAHKVAWKNAIEEIEELRCEIKLLRNEIDDLRSSVKTGIREGEMWRGVAVEVATEFHEETGRFPLAWPDSEPLPSLA